MSFYTEMQPLNINKYLAFTNGEHLVSLSDSQEDIMSPWIILLEIICLIRSQCSSTTCTEIQIFFPCSTMLHFSKQLVC